MIQMTAKYRGASIRAVRQPGECLRNAWFLGRLHPSVAGH